MRLILTGAGVVFAIATLVLIFLGVCAPAWEASIGIPQGSIAGPSLAMSLITLGASAAAFVLASNE